MKSWPHILNIILILIIILLFLGVIDTRKPVNVSDQILGFMKESNSKTALVIGDDGRTSVINENGIQIEECSVGPKGKYKQCKGLGPNGTVLSSQAFNVLRVKGSDCIDVIGFDGKSFEVCW